jgi:hypothetical protein
LGGNAGSPSRSSREGDARLRPSGYGAAAFAALRERRLVEPRSANITHNIFYFQWFMKMIGDLSTNRATTHRLIFPPWPSSLGAALGTAAAVFVGSGGGQFTLLAVR